MATLQKLSISDDLAVRLGDRAITLTPSEGLDLAEDLARKSFRRALAEEAADNVLARADAVVKAKQ